MKRNQNFDYNRSQKSAFLPLQHGHQPSGSPIQGWNHSFHRLHRH